MITKIISGGQTGADQAGLAAAKELGLETGGWAPKGWKTDIGSAKRLLEGYGLKECPIAGYPPRTYANVRDSDRTVWFGQQGTPGYWCTAAAIKTFNKGELYAYVTKQDFLRWVEENGILILNVAGNRERMNPGIFDRTKTQLIAALETQ